MFIQENLCASSQQMEGLSIISTIKPFPAPPVASCRDALRLLSEKASKGYPIVGQTQDTGLSSDCSDWLLAISKVVTASDAAVAPALAALRRIAIQRGAAIMQSSGDNGDAEMEFCHGARLEALSLDKPWLRVEDGLRLDVDPGERTRVWIHMPADRPVWLHILVCPLFDPSAEPVAALRYLHGNNAEEVALRFRRSGVVVHKEVEIPMPSGRPMLLSLCVFNGIFRLHLNGVPVYGRPARHPEATSFMLDVIGVTEGNIRLDVPFLAIESDEGFAATSTEKDCSLLALGLVEAARHSPVRYHLNEILHSLACAPLAYNDHDIQSMVAENRRAEGPFRDVLDDLLLARLADAGERHRLVGQRPMPVIRVRDVSIELASNPAGKTLSDFLVSRRKAKVRLLHELSFDGFSGDIIGIIGRNGAGKTTFLKSLIGAIPIATGRIDIAEQPILLRPGAGMQPELTGRQNIYKTGLYMNMVMSEIDAMINDVVRFAELEDHIDRPFKYYSDGMRARLIFSMATAMPRNILLLDELLSAGDMGFQERAMTRLHEFLSRSKLVFVVQHTFDFVLTRCTKCLLLEKGVPVYFGEPRIATELYRELL
jgi:ABC-type polysaccharide/polyol phosphate transport system ATPase subunit